MPQRPKARGNFGARWIVLSPVETLLFESTYASADAVAAAASGRWDGPRVNSYVRWTLRRAPPSTPRTAAWAAADKILRRGALIPAGRALEKRIAAAFGSRLQAALRAAHQIQLAALHHEAWSVAATDLRLTGRFTGAESAAILTWALEDLSALWRELLAVYPQPLSEGGPLFISFGGAGKAGWDRVEVNDGWPEAGEAEPWAAARPGETRADARTLRPLLSRLFRHDEFRPGQAEAVAALLRGGDVCALLPTGAGKSAIFQLAALLRPGTALIAQPLLALIDDQLRHLRRLGITAAARLGGAEASAPALAALGGGRLALCYFAPERLASAAFRRALRELAAGPGTAFVAVDEAHCAASWGHDFRPAYLELGRRARRWAAGESGPPPLAALTGTAGRAELEEASRALGLNGAVVGARSLSRPELRFEVRRCGAGEHLDALARWLTVETPRARFGPGLVFCPTVDGSLGAAAAAQRLLWGENVQTGCFTGRAPVGRERGWDAVKNAQARAFLDGGLDWLCCTRAFGLGVHKSDVRWTAHLGLPHSLEGFFQEAGRAGRDGEPALCLVFLNVRGIGRARRWLNPDLPVERLAAELEGLGISRADDVSRALALHARGYPGRAAELADARRVLAALGPADPARARRLRLPGQADGAVERALTRLSLSGLIEVLERRGESRLVYFRRRFTAQEALAAVERAVAEVYERVEPARRRSIAELFELCLSSDPGAALAERLARYGSSSDL